MTKAWHQRPFQKQNVRFESFGPDFRALFVTMASSRGVLTVLGFWLMNQVLGVFNSYMFRRKHFALPCFLSLAQSLVFALFVTVAARCGSARCRRAVSEPSVAAWDGSSSSSKGSSNSSVVSVAVWSTMNIVLNNVSLMYLPLSLNQVIRSTIPVVTAAVGAYHGDLPTKTEFASLTFVVGGVLLVIAESASVGGQEASQMALGLSFCMLGTIAAASALHATGRALKGDADSPDVAVVRLAWRVVPWNVGLVLPLFLAGEWRRLVDFWGRDWISVVWLTITSAVLASGYNLFHFAVNRQTGPVMTTVLGQVKIVCLVVVSRIWLEEGRGVRGMELLGLVVALGGLAWYGNGRQKTKTL